MTERGAFFIHRGIWEHTSFDDEPFTQREAWIWLISEAAYRPFKKRVAGHVIELKRGQVCHSQRFLAKAWGWTDSKVRRFLDRLKTDAMIDAETTQSYSIITICNYDVYQDFASQKDAETDAPFDAAPTQHRRSTDANYKTTKTTKTKDTTLLGAREPVEKSVEPAKAQSLVSPEALELADELAVICGHKLEFVPPAWCGAGMWVQKCLSEGWTPDEMREGTRGVVARGRKVDSFRYLEKPLADFVARNRAPLHVGEARGQGPPAAKPLTQFQQDRQKMNEVRDALKRFSTGGGSGGGDTARLLPDDSGQRPSGVRGGAGAAVFELSAASVANRNRPG